MRLSILGCLILAGCTTVVFQAANSERPVLVGPKDRLGTNTTAAALPVTAVHAESHVNQMVLAVLPAPQSRDTAVDGVDKPEALFRESAGYRERGLARISSIDIRAGTFLAALINAWAAWGTVHAEVLLFPETPTNAVEPPEATTNGTGGEAQP